jgi:general secretion pathway protein A
LYLKFFSLQEYPFSIGCEDRFFYESDIHAEALANMEYTVQQRKGMVLITGEVGAGKTFLANMLAARLGPSCLVVDVPHPADSAKQLLRSVAEGVGIETSGETDKLSLVRQLKDRLDQLHRRGRIVAVILDEVQDLPNSAMEEIRLMWNWERNGQRLLQFVLVGQPELRDRLQEPRWESLQQRIVLSYHLGRLGLRDTAKYILHRRKVAASNGCPLQFTVRAIEQIYAATRGIPRLINILCDNALLTAYARSTYKINSDIISTVLRDMTCWALNASAADQDSSYEPELRIEKLTRQ